MSSSSQPSHLSRSPKANPNPDTSSTPKYKTLNKH
ncbi:hypothetical protein M6B38_343730 [Iris pallida]|uniref:Uncharacterized protein n=1 Tax=Iris pallida TaxID=29817 RepID=A0AAX6DVT8_IRIPA|nr:hypothetical protein M6B38_224575 [Iris pallida]KAJ6832239.1 hypothetical protein M6B38_343725 [Iris pallida]KAJ6832240.1 hypothetical protein M6B38_343730 [Iris pallida]